VLTDQTALVAPEQCLPCPAGRVCPRQGIGRMQDTIACIEGYVCNEGTYPLIMFDIPCPEGRSPHHFRICQCIACSPIFFYHAHTHTHTHTQAMHVMTARLRRPCSTTRVTRASSVNGAPHSQTASVYPALWVTIGTSLSALCAGVICVCTHVYVCACSQQTRDLSVASCNCHLIHVLTVPCLYDSVHAAHS